MSGLIKQYDMSCHKFLSNLCRDEADPTAAKHHMELRIEIWRLAWNGSNLKSVEVESNPRIKAMPRLVGKEKAKSKNFIKTRVPAGPRRQEFPLQKCGWGEGFQTHWRKTCGHLYNIHNRLRHHHASLH